VQKKREGGIKRLGAEKISVAPEDKTRKRGRKKKRRNKRVNSVEKGMRGSKEGKPSGVRNKGGTEENGKNSEKAPEGRDLNNWDKGRRTTKKE